MTELKTLNDMKLKDSAGELEIVSFYDLKQLAIKWCKDPKKLNQNWFKNFMEFHNLTDEDLQ